jgi:hypothetical protein
MQGVLCCLRSFSFLFLLLGGFAHHDVRYTNCTSQAAIKLPKFRKLGKVSGQCLLQRSLQSWTGSLQRHSACSKSPRPRVEQIIGEDVCHAQSVEATNTQLAIVDVLSLIVSGVAVV